MSSVDPAAEATPEALPVLRAPPRHRDPEIVLFTKTYLADLERVLSLLRSLRYVGNSFRHVVVIDDADVASMTPLLREFDVEVVPTSVMIPPSMRRATAVYGRCMQLVPRNSRAAAIASRVSGGVAAGLDGWWSQQIVKLAASRSFPGSLLVNADSDVLFLDAPSAEWFRYPDGGVRLFEREALSLKEIEWRLRAHRLLGIDRFADSPGTYTTMPQVVDSRIASDLIDFLEERHRGPWWRTMLSRRVTEYELYGSFAEHLASVPIRAGRAVWSLEISPWRVEDSAAELESRLRHDGPPLSTVWLQSKLPAAEYARLHRLISESRFEGGL